MNTPASNRRLIQLTLVGYVVGLFLLTLALFRPISQHPLIGQSVRVETGHATGNNGYSSSSHTAKLVAIDASWVTLSFGHGRQLSIPASHVISIYDAD